MGVTFKGHYFRSRGWKVLVFSLKVVQARGSLPAKLQHPFVNETKMGGPGSVDLFSKVVRSLPLLVLWIARCSHSPYVKFRWSRISNWVMG